MSDTQSLALEINSSCSFFYDLLLPTVNRDEPILIGLSSQKLTQTHTGWLSLAESWLSDQK